MPRMSHDEIEAFLAEPGHLVRIGSVDADGTPRVVPTWFLYRDGTVLFTPRRASVVLANLRRDPRVGLSIDEEALPYRKVTMQGRVRILHDLGADDRWRDTYRVIATRYVPVAQAEAYLQSTIDQPRALRAVALADSRMTTWRMPRGTEHRTGIWATRYYQPGSAMRQLGDAEPAGPHRARMRARPRRRDRACGTNGHGQEDGA